MRLDGLALSLVLFVMLVVFFVNRTDSNAMELNRSESGTSERHEPGGTCVEWNIGSDERNACVYRGAPPCSRMPRWIESERRMHQEQQRSTKWTRVGTFIPTVQMFDWPSNAIDRMWSIETKQINQVRSIKRQGDKTNWMSVMMDFFELGFFFFLLSS